MQTSIEWFYDQITRTYWDYMTTERQNELFEQAKEMHNNEMINFAEWYHASKDENKLSNGRFTNKEIIKQYYSEIFKKD